MKILPVNLIRDADAYTIKHNPIASIDLMEQAAQACVNWITQNFGQEWTVIIYCGLGNNGGDGLAIARMLAAIDYNVEVKIIMSSAKSSQDFETNIERLNNNFDVKINEINSVDDLENIWTRTIIIDAIFGTGLSKPAKGLYAEVINHINKQEVPVISIDIPSGLYCDDHVGGDYAIVKALQVLTFQFPKLAFMFSQNANYVNYFQILPIGLNEDFINAVETKNYYTTKEDIRNIYIPRGNKFAHKGNYGQALLVSGSLGKMGAAILSSKACLRSGVGLLTIHCPSSANIIIQTTVPEAMVDLDADQNIITSLNSFDKYNVIGIGPGIGMDALTMEALKNIILNYDKPMVIDADAINILSRNKDLLNSIPKHSILTPHLKEFERLFGSCSNDFERNTVQREMSGKYNIYIVLKGAHTAITTPEGDCYFNSTGNAGMATAGSGDVLTGIITGLLAQGYQSKDAAILGVFLHGLAGNIYASGNGMESLIAGDIIDNLCNAFYDLSEQIISDLFDDDLDDDEI